MNLYKKNKDKNGKFYYLVISKDGKKRISKEEYHKQVGGVGNNSDNRDSMIRDTERMLNMILGRRNRKINNKSEILPRLPQNITRGLITKCAVRGFVKSHREICFNEKLVAKDNDRKGLKNKLSNFFRGLEEVRKTKYRDHVSETRYGFEQNPRRFRPIIYIEDLGIDNVSHFSIQKINIIHPKLNLFKGVISEKPRQPRSNTGMNSYLRRLEIYKKSEKLFSFYNKTLKTLFSGLEIYNYHRVYNHVNYRMSMVLKQPNGFLIGFYEFLDLFVDDNKLNTHNFFDGEFMYIKEDEDIYHISIYPFSGMTHYKANGKIVKHNYKYNGYNDPNKNYSDEDLYLYNLAIFEGII